MKDELAQLRKEQVENPLCYCGNRWIIFRSGYCGFIRMCPASMRPVSFCNDV